MTATPQIITPGQPSKPMAVPERPILDLSIRHFERKTGPFLLVGTWLKKGRREPCLVILPRFHKIENAVPCVVPLSSAWRWSEEYGDELWAAITAVAFARVLPGLNHLKVSDVNKVLDAVRGSLGDLANMPPAPVTKRKIAGDLKFTNRETGEVTQKDILDDV